MASATLSTLAGSLLSPLCDISLEKLIGYLWDYLSSSPSPSSPDEAEKQQQLKNSLEALEDAKSNVKLMQSRIMKLFEKHKQNERVVGLHNKLKDVGYDIQDLESEMKYMELERKVQEINKADEEADTTTTSQSSRRLKRLFQFLPHSSEKKRRLSTSSQSLSLSTDDDIVRKVASIIKQINSIDSKLKDEIKLEEWFDQITLNGVYDPREQHHFTQNERVTTSSPNEREILYGRHDEIQRLFEILKGPNVNGDTCVVPIAGIGGIGKTTLAQFVFNNREIENHFDYKGWISVSDHFDRFKITKEIVEIISPTVQCCSATNLDLLERQLKRHLTGKKFLLVLDNLWSDKWQQLLAPLQSTQAQAIKIIVTCRDPKVLRSIDKENKIILEGLSDQDYWSLFVNCAVGQNNLDNYSPALNDIGKRIVKKLKGSPLAAKTVGKLLGRDLTEEHWKHVLESDLWKLEADPYDIMPALALSYYHLPQHLQLCFAFCSLIPKGYSYDIDRLIFMWIANGYIHESRSSSKTLNDIGKEYYYKLVELCFFREVDFPFKSFKMHDLMRDLAQLVCHGEICVYKSGEVQKISKNVHHFHADSLIDPWLACEANNLRTLVLKRTIRRRRGFSLGPQVYKELGMPTSLKHEACTRIRVLIISDFGMEEFPDAICLLKHLQYLDLLGTSIKSIPESLCSLYQLRVLLLPYPHTLPSQFHNLINLQKWCMFQESGIVFDLVYFVDKERGYMIAQLRNMNELRGPLEIANLEKVDNMEEAMKTKLKEKRHLEDLGLSWNDTRDGCNHDVQEEVLEGLQPHPNLKELKIRGYMGSKTPSWLMTLQKLKRIDLGNCRNCACLLAALGLLPTLQCLVLFKLENITVECDDSVTEMFPSLELLGLRTTTISFKGMSTSSSSSSSSSSTSSLTTPGAHRKFFPRLQDLGMEFCKGFNGFPWPVCSALKQLYIKDSSGLDDQLPGCLYGLSSLTGLKLHEAKIKTLPAEVMATLRALECLELSDCKELLSVEGLQALPSLNKLYIIKCPKFRCWCMEEMTKLHEIFLDSCQDLESLPVWLHRLPLLKQLRIRSCRKFNSLPKGGLPSSIETLEIRHCDPSLMERCQQERSPEWLMIQHIPKCRIS